MRCVSAFVDTDRLGTFSGEVERKGGIRQTLREKIKMAMEAFPQDRFFLASEGSFGPHPQIGLVPSDLESLLFYDAQSRAEVYVEFLSTNVVHEESEFSPRDDFRAFLKRIHFPGHGVIVRPFGESNTLFKGLHDEGQVIQALLESFVSSKNGKVVMATDLRAHHNPTRQQAIREAGKKLIESLRTHCPRCRYPGFAIRDVVPGLTCMGCGDPSPRTKGVIYSCVSCDHEETGPRPDGVTALNPEECESCNP